MSEPITIKLPMPFVKVGVSGLLTKVNKPSGMQYLLLRMLQFGEEANGKYTINDLIKLFGFPADMTQFIIVEIKNLIDKQMVECHGKLTPGLSLERINLTESGRDVFERGMVSVETRTIDIHLTYLPGHLVRIMREVELDTVPGKNYDMDGGPDLASIEKYIRGNQEQYGIEPDDKIYNMKAKLDRVKSYEADIYIEFDERSGEFIFTNKSSARTDFLKTNYSGEEIIKRIPDYPFDLPNDLGFEVKRWGDAPDGYSFTTILPFEFSPYIKLLVNGQALAKISPNIKSMTMPGIDCDMAYFESRNSAYKVWFARKDTGVSGFDGTKNIKLVLSHRMSAEETSDLISAMLDSTRFEWGEDLEYLDTLCSIRNDGEPFIMLISRQMAAPGLDTIRDVFSRIGKFSESQWWSLLPAEMEKLLCKWSESLPKEEISKCVEALDRRNVHLNGSALTRTIAERYDKVSAIDFALRYDLDYKSLVGSDGIIGILTEPILQDLPLPSESKQFEQFNAAKDALTNLKTLIGIQDCRGYRIETRQWSEEEVKELSRLTNNIKSAIDSMESLAGQKPDKKNNLVLFYSLFDTYVGAVKVRRQFRTRSDYYNEDNPYSFFLRLDEKLRFESNRLTGLSDPKSLIKALGKKEAPDQDLLDPLKKFIIASEKGLHTDITREIDLETRKEWATAVFKLTELRKRTGYPIHPNRRHMLQHRCVANEEGGRGDSSPPPPTINLRFRLNESRLPTLPDLRSAPTPLSSRMRHHTR